jgi:hypothetical protein
MFELQFYSLQTLIFSCILHRERHTGLRIRRRKEDETRGVGVHGSVGGITSSSSTGPRGCTNGLTLPETDIFLLTDDFSLRLQLPPRNINSYVEVSCDARKNAIFFCGFNMPVRVIRFLVCVTQLIGKYLDLPATRRSQNTIRHQIFSISAQILEDSCHIFYFPICASLQKKK